MTVVAASLSLLLHVLPPYRPLIHRVRSAESIALVEITRQTRQQLAFDPKMLLHGEALKSARIQPGHKPSAKARFGLATFRRIAGRWHLQDQAREWIELEPSAWRAHPPTAFSLPRRRRPRRARAPRRRRPARGPPVRASVRARASTRASRAPPSTRLERTTPSSRGHFFRPPKGAGRTEVPPFGRSADDETHIFTRFFFTT